MIWQNVHDTYKREMGSSVDLGSGKSRLTTIEPISLRYHWSENGT